MGLLLPVKSLRKHFQSYLANQPKIIQTHFTKQLLVDVSVIIKDDARTGIQRVVRSILIQLLANPPKGYEVRPVFATKKRCYSYANSSFLQQPSHLSSSNKFPVKVKNGDVFLGLDLSAHLLPRHQTQLIGWKQQGVSLHILIYDLLPLIHPEWFNDKTVKNFRGWMKTLVMLADSAICISESVKKELEDWLLDEYQMETGLLKAENISLGADINASMPSKGLPKDIDRLLALMEYHSSVLIVGTLEPRKGHEQTLDAFELLWEQGQEINLIIVGNPGWKTETLQKRLKVHPQTKKHLFWFENASDELLELLYNNCTGVIVASQAEGLGLPVIEAMHFGKPILLRDIPVFREIGRASATYFSSISPNELQNDIANWLTKIENGQSSYNIPQQTWQNSAHELLASIGLANTETKQLYSEGISSSFQHETAQ